MVKRKRAMVRVTKELLIDALKLPEDTEIISVHLNYEIYPSVIEIVVEHPELKQIDEGERIPIVNPRLEKIIYKFDWNQ